MTSIHTYSEQDFKERSKRQYFLTLIDFCFGIPISFFREELVNYELEGEYAICSGMYKGIRFCEDNDFNTVKKEILRISNELFK